MRKKQIITLKRKNGWQSQGFWMKMPAGCKYPFYFVEEIRNRIQVLLEIRSLMPYQDPFWVSLNVSKIRIGRYYSYNRYSYSTKGWFANKFTHMRYLSPAEQRFILGTGEST